MPDIIVETTVNFNLVSPSSRKKTKTRYWSSMKVAATSDFNDFQSVIKIKQKLKMLNINKTRDH